MSLELLDFFDFITSGGTMIVGCIALILLVMQAMIAYVLWRKGEKEYLRRFISYLFAIISIFFGLTYLSTNITFIQNLGIIMFCLCMILSLAAPIYIYIRDTWIKKEEKT